MGLFKIWAYCAAIFFFRTAIILPIFSAYPYKFNEKYAYDENI